ncbi:MAG TPA: T9SS type A sorting domain-containing protein [Bacteroidetes bacterium]|nr:T9SS type A sorting domain-containing protein [Bacteroidota bacterium]
MKNILTIILLFATTIIYAQGKFFGGDGGGFAFSELLNQALPVELVYFNGEAASGHILLHWATATEINNEGFIIEKMNKNGRFISIGFIKGQGNSFTETKYNFTDKNPADGINYYRLAQKDFAGKTNYSETIAIEFSKNNLTINISPNPFSDYLNINIGEEERNQFFQIYTLSGKIIFRSKTIPEHIELSDLNPGTYLVLINDKTIKITKN